MRRGPEQLSNGVRVATWKRDRLGYLQTADMTRQTAQPRHVISAPIDLEGQACTVSLNVDGLSEYSQVTVDILNERFQPLEGYSREDCLPLASGFHQTVKWKQGETCQTSSRCNPHPSQLHRDSSRRS